MIFIKTSKNTTQIKKSKILIVFDDMTADILSNKKLNPILTEFFIRGRRLNISLVFITQSYFANENFNKLHLIIHQMNDIKDFMNLYKKCTAKPYSFLLIDATPASINLLRFRKNLSDII